MVDKERVLGKIDKLDSYINELNRIIPSNFDEFQIIEKKRSCERLLQLCIECIIDICKLFVSGLRLGLPSEENDLFDKMKKSGLLSEDAVDVLKEMRGFRNILIHEYAAVNDEIVYNTVKTRLGDFQRIKQEIVESLNK